MAAARHEGSRPPHPQGGAKRPADQPPGQQPPALRSAAAAEDADVIPAYATSPTPQPLRRAAAAARSSAGGEGGAGPLGGEGGAPPLCERSVVIADALQRLRSICLAGTDAEAFGRLVALLQAINNDHYDQYRSRPCTCAACAPSAGYAVVRQLRHAYRAVDELQAARHELQAVRRQLQAAEPQLQLQQRQLRLAEELLQLQADLAAHQKQQGTDPPRREKKV